MSETCPDCGNPVSSHTSYKDARCPVVRFQGVELVRDPTMESGVAEVRDPDGSVAVRIENIGE